MRSYSQKLSIREKEVPLSKIFLLIQQQTDYSLLYDNQLLKKTTNISIDKTDASVEEVLDHCFKNLPLTYVITGKIIVIKEKTEPVPAVPLLAQIVQGTVKDELNCPVAGASVILKETGIGKQTNQSGNFLFNDISPGTYTLEVSFVGFVTEKQVIHVNVDSLRINIKLKIMEVGLREITVATALGITKKERALTYSMQTVRNNDISTVKNTNVLNSLNGKVAGAQINRTSAGAGGSVRVVLRGDKSTRSSQPLYVIDGIPIINPTGGPDAGLYNTAPDGGDILSSINPDDIENINILKGASASALYGSLGSNGVILISTKKGKQGQSRINFSSSLSAEQAFVFPELQYSYLQSTPQTTTSPGSENSWGVKAAQPLNDYVNSFFRSGVTSINSINISSGNENSSNYLSYSNTFNRGILPGSRFTQHTFNLHQSGRLLNNKLVVDAMVLGSVQNSHNRATPGVYFNPLTGLYLLPRGLDFNNYRSFEYFSPSRYLYAQNWWNINHDKNLSNSGWVGEDYQQNPYWVSRRNAIENRNQNIYTSALLKYAFNSAVSIQARGNINNYISENHRRIYATTQSTISYVNGRYNQSRTNSTTLYGDLLFSCSKNWQQQFSLDLTAGVSLQQQQGRTVSTDGEPSVPNVFLESALTRNNLIIQNNASVKQIQSVFANLQLGYKNKIFIDLSDRNDWSSTLAFTPTEKRGYNYYSAGVSAVLNEMFLLPSTVDLAKLRIAWAIVGNDIAPFSTYPLYTFASGTATPPFGSPLNIPGYFLKPEKNSSLEIGMQCNLFDNRLLIDLTWYRSNITNQYFQRIAVPPGLGTGGFADINAGNIRNSGIELIASGRIIKQENFNWDIMLNLSHNKNRIIELFNTDVVSNPSPDQLYRLFGGSGEYGVLKKGGSYNDIYGRAFLRDTEGRVVINGSTGIPYFVNDKFLGNPNPAVIAGLKNNFTWQRWSLTCLIDGKIGGKVLSITEAYLDQMGVSKRTADVRDQGDLFYIQNAVDENGQQWKGTTSVKEYYQKLGGKTPVGEAYLYDATAIRLRELSVIWRIPVNSKVIREFKLGLVGSNLFFFTRKAPFDPEQVPGVNPGGVGVDVFGLPAYRSMGITVNGTF